MSDLHKFAKNLRGLATDGDGHPAAALMNAAQAIDDLLAQLAAERARADELAAQLAAAYQENDALVAQHNEMDTQLAAERARVEAAEAKLAAIPMDDICKAISQIDADWQQSARIVRDWQDSLIFEGESRP